MSSEPPPAVAVRNLSKTYLMYSRPHYRLFDALSRRLRLKTTAADSYPAVTNVSFTVAAGESVALLGRNGSGKSTTLQLVAGTLHPTAGEVEVHGRLSALLELGTGFNDEYTGRENLRLNAQILGMSEREIAEVEPTIIAFADIGRFIDEPVRTYSSGMYVRLAFSVAVHVNPDVLIVDEALAVGDIFFQQKCADYLGSKMHDTTKLFVTHDLTMASRLATRGIVFDQGRVSYDGPIDQAVRQYLTLGLEERAPQAETLSITTPSQPATADATEMQGIDWFRCPDSVNSSPRSARVTHFALRSGSGDSAAPWVDSIVCSPGKLWKSRSCCALRSRSSIRSSV